MSTFHNTAQSYNVRGMRMIAPKTVRAAFLIL